MKFNYFSNFNKEYEDRYKRSIEEINKIEKDTKEASLYNDYFNSGSQFILKMDNLLNELDEDYFDKYSFEELQVKNQELYKNVLKDEYNNSYANTQKTAELFGLELGQVLSHIYSKIMSYIPLVFENNISAITLTNELFIKIYNLINEKDISKLKSSILEEVLEDLEIKIEKNLLRKFDYKFNYYSKILLDSDLNDLRYLFKYGMYIDENEINTAKYILGLPEEKINKIADVFTDAFIRGYENGNKEIPLSDKETINLAYPIGFERILRKAAKNFEKINLKPLVYTDSFTAARPRLISTRPSSQYAYDHRFDEAIFYSKEYTDAFEKAYTKVLKKHQDKIKVMAGPAVFECFGEEPFSPVSKPTNISYNEEQTEIKNAHTTIINKEYRKYLPGSAYSFVIVSYPLPSIGDKYEEIFDEIVKVNTLDNDTYSKIQKVLIDTLDKGEYVRLIGKGSNRTNMLVKLHTLNNPEKETNFENCTADVNIPVGEVFTSPVLAETTGKIHVSQVYLEGYKYIDFEMTFKDGMIIDYNCLNFDSEEDNKKFIYENLIHPHKTLPIGEFAIGTNTTAYVIAKKYNIEKYLPILIAEKMGPHFAIGDTCYSWSEDLYVCNPDGKEIIARDNEKSILRKTNISEAYTYKHTDITIPYDELDLIEVIMKNGESKVILKDGRFILSGTELLNEPFKETVL